VRPTRVFLCPPAAAPGTRPFARPLLRHRRISFPTAQPTPATVPPKTPAVFCNFRQIRRVISYVNHRTFNPKNSATMKTTAILLVAALLAPAALALGLSAAVVSTAATGIALSSIALGDYAKPVCSYW